MNLTTRSDAPLRFNQHERARSLLSIAWRISPDIRPGDGVEELYRFPPDLSAGEDLALRPDSREQVRQFRARLDACLQSTPR